MYLNIGASAPLTTAMYIFPGRNLGKSEMERLILKETLDRWSQIRVRLSTYLVVRSVGHVINSRRRNGAKEYARRCLPVVTKLFAPVFLNSAAA